MGTGPPYERAFVLRSYHPRMTEKLSPTEIEIVRRSLVMSPTLPAPTAERLLTEIQRLREQLTAVDGELAEIEARIRRARAHVARD